jgi:hypothetical protein
LYASYLMSPNAEEGWKDGFEFLDQHDSEASCGLLFYPGFIESQTIDWYTDQFFGNFLRSHFSYYHVSRQPMLLPYTLDLPQAKAYLETKVIPFALENSCLALMYRNRELFIDAQVTRPSQDYLNEWILSKGFRIAQEKRNSLVQVRLYRK